MGRAVLANELDAGPGTPRSPFPPRLPRGGPAAPRTDRARSNGSTRSGGCCRQGGNFFRVLTRTKQWAYDLAMTLKNAALFALIGMALLTVLLAAGFIRDFSAFLNGVVAAIELLKSGIHLLASLSVAVFLYVFHKAQS